MSWKEKQNQEFVPVTRAILLTGSFFYFIFGFIYQNLDANFIDPLWVRGLFSGALLILFGLSFNKKFAEHYLHKAFMVTVWAITVHFFYLVSANHLSFFYMAGVFLVVGIILPLHNNNLSTRSFALFSLVAGTIAGWSSGAPFLNALFFELSILTTVSIGSLIQLYRFKTAAALEKQIGIEAIILGNLTEGVIMFDANGTVISSNPASEKIIGRGAGSLRGRSVQKELPHWITENNEEYPQKEYPAIVALRTGLPQFNKLMGVNRADGTQTWVSVNAVPLFKEDDVRPTGVVCSLHDITEIRLAQQRVTDQQARLAVTSKLSALGEMASGVAHEINNPLAIISGRAGQLQRLLEKEPLDKARMLELIQSVSDTTTRISKIIHGLRTFARDGRQDPFEITPIKKIIDDTLVLCKEKFTRHNVEVQVDPIGDDVAIACRPGQISQIVLNLLQNAFDALSAQDEKKIHVGIVSKENSIALTVEDNGPGIPPDVRGKIMQPFFTTKEVGKGTGLGLSISVGLANDHGGSLTLDPTASKTRFVLTLPRTQSQFLKKAA